ncbi:glycosyltransferase family 4 protein, partial [Candidatus Micrarchaeota archaeon]|nr:glycosyltransferase family 4 protein [Candidatus Micrarchaeota archaeon]
MKVLHISHHFWPCIGGTEKYIMDLCLELKKKGIESEVVCLNKCPNSEKKLKEKETIKGIKINRIPFWDFRLYKIAPKVTDFIKEFDLIHIHGIGFFSDFLLAKKNQHKKPVIISTHGGIFHTNKKSLIKKLYNNFWLKHHLKKVDKIIADSKNDFDQFKNISGKVVLVQNAADTKKFESKEKKNYNKCIFVGRLSKNKRIDLLIERFGEIEKEFPEKTLEIIGEDFDGIKKELEEKVKKSRLQKKVFFRGKISEKKLIGKVKKAGFCLSASEYEGFGIAVIESMAAGTIPVLNNIQAFRELIENKKTGFIIDFKKENSLKRIFEKKEKELNEISKNCVKKAKRFEWKEKIKEIEKI